MMFLLHLLAFLAFLLSGFTLIRPTSGWGRLALFVPKLFAGTFIGLIGAVGLASALTGWFVLGDMVPVGPGVIAMGVASRHVLRIRRRRLQINRSLSAEPALKLKENTPSYLWSSARRTKPEVIWQRDQRVGTHMETGEVLLADLWHPSDPEIRSGLGLIYLHGSGWHYASKDYGTRPFFRRLAQQGHVIADLAYTLAPHTDLFGMVADVRRTIAWMKNHARELRIRDDSIVLMGGSSGGHLALLAGYTYDDPRFVAPEIKRDTLVLGVVSYYGPPDLKAQFDRLNELPGLTGRTSMERLFMSYLEARFGFEPLPVHSLLPQFLGGTPLEVPDLYEAGSPCNHVRKDRPSTLLLQGLHDFSGAAPEARKLYTGLKKAGCAAFLFELPDTEHGFDLYFPRWSPAARAATCVTERFLASLC